jgi:hypothetical protein
LQLKRRTLDGPPTLMKTLTPAGLLLMLTVGPALGQAGQREEPVFGEEVRHYSSSLRLPALSSGIEPGRLEIRIWVGFGITGVDLYQI